MKSCPLIARQYHFPIKTEQLSRDRHDTRRYMPIQSLLDTALTPSVPFCVPSRLYLWVPLPAPPGPLTPLLPPNASSPPNLLVKGLTAVENHCTLFWPLWLSPHHSPPIPKITHNPTHPSSSSSSKPQQIVELRVEQRLNYSPASSVLTSKLRG